MQIMYLPFLHFVSPLLGTNAAVFKRLGLQGVLGALSHPNGQNARLQVQLARLLANLAMHGTVFPADRSHAQNTHKHTHTLTRMCLLGALR